MNTNRIRHGAAGALALAALVALSVVSAAAQGHAGHGQSSEMPYDLHYIDMTIMHHEQGVEMARLAEEKGADARVKAFARRTAGDQQRDIAVLRGHRQQWYSDRPLMSHEQMTAHMQAMPGHGSMKMDPEADMRKLRAAEGRAFDRLFLDTMTHHHQMAVGMSKEAQGKAEHAELRQFAAKAVAKQQAELAEMKRLSPSVGGGKAAARKPAPKKRPAAKKPAAHSGHHD